MVRQERLELSRLAALEPKSSASTNSATGALHIRVEILSTLYRYAKLFFIFLKKALKNLLNIEKDRKT